MKKGLIALLIGIMIILGSSRQAWAAGEDAAENELKNTTQDDIDKIDNYDVPEAENKAVEDSEAGTDKEEDIENQAVIKEKSSDAVSFSEFDEYGLKWEVADGVLTVSGNGLIERNPSIANNDNLRESITSVIIGEGVTEIGYLAFSEYHNLIEVVIPNSVRKIGVLSFAHCGLTSVSLPDGLTEIGEEAFYDCFLLSQIVISDSVTKIGYGAFGGCAITSTKFIPESVTEIGTYVFHDCRNLTEISLPGNITKISEGMFYNCENLTEAMIPNSVTWIDNRAFELCGGMTKVTIPDSVKKIGQQAFSFCTGLQTVVFQGDAPEVEGDVSDEYLTPFHDVTAIAYYPLGNLTYTEAIKAKYGTGLTWEAKRSLKIILETTKNTHILGTSDTATITCNGELKDFVNIFVDGTEVEKSNYILAEGSTILTFTAQYLNTLSVGKHAVTLNYTYGSVDTELIILSTGSVVNETDSADASGKTGVSVKSIAARTGDNTAEVPWLLTALAAVVISAGVVLIRRKQVV